MPHYSQERKEAILKKLLPPYSRSISDVAKEEGISESALYNWRKSLRDKGTVLPSNNITPEHWSAQTKLAVVAETFSMTENELSQYCREKGLYPEQIHQWRSECMHGFMSTKEQAAQAKKQAQSDKHEIKSLKKELRHKEKALAETAALLVLRKKLKAFYGEHDEDD